MRCLVFILGFTLALPAMAQDRETLADIRQELSMLYYEIQTLRRELNTTGSPQITISGDTLRRMDAIEAEMNRLTSRTEELENSINRVVSDGTNRIGDLEFRLCELESGCDIANMGETIMLGGGDGTIAPLAPLDGGGDGVELAVGEASDFQRAEDAHDSGNYRAAADQFADFIQNYPGGPLSGEAHFLRGEALSQLGDWNAAARAYLESFSGSPNDSRAPEALHKLGLSLDKLGQREEACLMLQEVTNRFPGSDQVGPARKSMQRLSCS